MLSSANIKEFLYRNFRKLQVIRISRLCCSTNRMETNQQIIMVKAKLCFHSYLILFDIFSKRCHEYLSEFQDLSIVLTSWSALFYEEHCQIYYLIRLDTIYLASCQYLPITWFFKTILTQQQFFYQIILHM